MNPNNPPKDPKEHKDFSTAILEKKKAPNRLIVSFSSLLSTSFYIPSPRSSSFCSSHLPSPSDPSFFPPTSYFFLLLHLFFYSF